jgi:hypothetical protein
MVVVSILHPFVFGIGLVAFAPIIAVELNIHLRRIDFDIVALARFPALAIAGGVPRDTLERKSPTDSR